jgi:hypothetical protein
VIQGFADPNDADKNAASLDRANRAREQLIRSGVDPNRLVAVGNGQQPGHAAGVRIMEVPPEAIGTKPADPKADAASSEPIGTSHFESKSRMSVGRGTSAMVSILSTETDGEVVYLYDAESPRGNAAFPFKSVRIKNPTDSVLESGPVTVFGDGKFIGEGLSEPIPARSTAFIPFALDRQSWSSARTPRRTPSPGSSRSSEACSPPKCSTPGARRWCSTAGRGEGPRSTSGTRSPTATSSRRRRWCRSGSAAPMSSAPTWSPTARSR